MLLIDLISNPENLLHGTRDGADMGCMCPRCSRARADAAREARSVLLSDLMASAALDTATVHIAGDGDRTVELPRAAS